MRADVSAPVAGDHPALRFFIGSKGVLPAGRLIHFSLMERIHRTGFYAQAAVLTNGLLFLIRFKWRAAKNGAQPDHASEFRCDQQGMSSERSKPCGVCGMLQGDDGTPPSGTPVPLAFIGGNRHGADAVFLQTDTEIQGNPRNSAQLCPKRLSQSFYLSAVHTVPLLKNKPSDFFPFYHS